MEYQTIQMMLLLLPVSIFRMSQQSCRIKLDYQNLLGPQTSSMITLNVRLENANSVPTMFTANIYNQSNHSQVESISSNSERISVPRSSLSSPELVFNFTVNVNNCISDVYNLHMLSTDNFTTELIAELGECFCLPRLESEDIAISRESYKTCTCLIYNINNCNCSEVLSDLIGNDHLCFSNFSNTLNNSFIYFLRTGSSDRFGSIITLIGRTKIILFEARTFQWIAGPADVYVQVGETAKFPCNFTGSDAVPWWIINNGIYHHSQLPSRHTYSNGILYVDNVEVTDNMAQYRCEVYQCEVYDPEIFASTFGVLYISEQDPTSTSAYNTQEPTVTVVPCPITTLATLLSTAGVISTVLVGITSLLLGILGGIYYQKRKTRNIETSFPPRNLEEGVLEMVT